MRDSEGECRDSEGECMDSEVECRDSKGECRESVGTEGDSHSLARARREVLTARECSIGSSEGTTNVRMSVHSRNNLYLLRVGSSVPAANNTYLTFTDSS